MSKRLFPGIILAFLLSLSWEAMGQNPQLLDNSWYLEKLIIDGEEIIPPYVEIEPVVGRIYFEEESVTISFCDFRVWDTVYDPNENLFELGNWIAAGQGCDRPENFLFEPVYSFIFYEGEFTKNPFHYEIITGSGGILSLTVTNVEGDQAMYGNVFLSVAYQQLSDIVIYPNPATSEVKIIHDKVPIVGLELYTITGRRINTDKDNLDSVDVSKLAEGVYLLRISSEYGSVVKKIVKRKQI